MRDLLNANLVRRITHPLRRRHPRIYSLLNRGRKRLLTGCGDLDAYQANALRRFEQRARIRGARVLEIGSDPSLRVLQALMARGAREAVGVNNSADLWASRSERVIEMGGARLLDADAGDLPFPGASFDLIFSVAVLEHLLDLPRALEEMHRVLVPGGLVHASFGPIWSSGKGHHLSIELGDRELRHFIPEKNPLPDFSHLLLAPDAMRGALRSRVEPEWIEPAVDYVFSSTAINRLFYHEYLEIFDRSPLRLESIRSELDPVHPQLRRILEFRHPGERHFDVTNAETVLIKDG